MDCREARERIQDLLDERLSAGESGALRVHLDSCAACAREHAALARTRELVASLPRATAPEGFSAGIAAALEGRSVPRGRRLLLPLALVASAAAVLLVAVLAGPHAPAADPADETPTAERFHGDELPAEPPAGARDAPANRVEAAERPAPAAPGERSLDGRKDGGRRGSPQDARHLDRLEESAASRHGDRDGAVLEVSVTDPAAFELRVLALLTSVGPEAERGRPGELVARTGAERPRATGPGDESKGAGGESAPASRAGSAPGRGPAPAPSPDPAAERRGAPADAPDEARTAYGDAEDELREKEEDRERIGRRAGAGKSTAAGRDVVLTPEQRARLIALLAPESRGALGSREGAAKDEGESDDAPLAAKKLGLSADDRALLEALRSLGDGDEEPVRLRLVLRAEAGPASGGAAGR